MWHPSRDFAKKVARIRHNWKMERKRREESANKERRSNPEDRGGPGASHLEDDLQDKLETLKHHIWAERKEILGIKQWEWSRLKIVN